MAPELRTVLSPLLFHEKPTEEQIEGILNRSIWIWITANSYVSFDDCAVDSRHEKQFELYLRDTEEHNLSIHASTLEEAIVCLNYLLDLKDTHFVAMGIAYKDDIRVYQGIRLCPLGADSLEKMLLQNAERLNIFNNMIFTPDHCRTLATSGIETNIEFCVCAFQDGGVAYVEASTARQDETSGPAILGFFYRLPFNDINWALFLSQHKLKSLEIRGIHLNSEVGCRAVATAQVQCLTFTDQCELEDGGAALVESVRQGLGPKGLFFDGLRNDGHPFDSSERLVTFISALRCNTNLERLELPRIKDRQVTQALAAALHENKGLVHLAVYFSVLDDSDRTELLKAISLHPSLCSLDLRCPRSDAKERQNSTKAVADMLSVNERIDVMSFHRPSFDKDDWNMYVVPRLECNVYRKRFPSIHKIGEASTRAAVLARALEKFSSKPHLVWMLLNQNLDIVSRYLDAAHDQISIPSRKRSRSNSLDGMSVH
jgi:hypothetical protein